MKKFSYFALGLVSALTVGFGVVAVANADTTNAKTDVGSSGIPRTVFRQDKLDASAKVLKVSTAAVIAARKDKTMATLISNAGLTKETFAQKVKAELTSELESQGYSQNQITIALQHRQIMHLRHDRTTKTSTRRTSRFAPSS